MRVGSCQATTRAGAYAQLVQPGRHPLRALAQLAEGERLSVVLEAGLEAVAG